MYELKNQSSILKKIKRIKAVKRERDVSRNKKWKNEKSDDDQRKPTRRGAPPFLFKAECGHSCHRDLSAVHGSSSNSHGFHSLVMGRRHRCYRLGRKGTPAPSTLLEQAFEILSSGYHQGLQVDAPEPS